MLLPPYAELPTIEGTGERHAWDVFGTDDQLGTLNLLTPELVTAAAGEVESGQVICLSLPLTLPRPPLVGGRPAFHHKVTRSRLGRDDSVDGFFLQGSSQWDGLQHIRFREFGYYGGRDEDQLDRGALGIDVMAVKGIVGRGTLLDVERHLRETGAPVDPRSRTAIDPALLEDALRRQGAELRRGDVLLLRTGWLTWYLGLDQAARDDLEGRLNTSGEKLATPGLAPGPETAAWLWDHGVSAVAADNPALEVLPIRRDEGFLHRRILALLGMPIGEFFLLDELADACAAQRRWSFMFNSAPLRLPGGVGSPNNAHAIL